MLIVEDDCDISIMLEQIMLMDGHEVRVGHNGEDGMRLVDEDKPDIVILDIEMPVLSGPGIVLRMFAHNCGFEKIPIILMSGHVDLDGIAKEVGTPYKLAKPFQIEELFSLVQRVSREKIFPRPPSNEVSAT
ncbi:MAG: response regulator [Bdellovibrionia bacterium]